MVKILSIALARLTDEELKNNNGEPVILSQAYELSEFGFFQRGGVREMLTFFTRTFVKRTGKGKRQCVEHEGHLCHVQMRANGLACCIITDQDYPSRVAFSAAQDLLRQFEEQSGQSWKSSSANAYDSFNPLTDAIVKYQDPQAADKICKIQKELDETMDVMHQTIDKVLERGVKLDDLVEKSKDLSGQSKMFYKTARDHNRCCVIS